VLWKTEFASGRNGEARISACQDPDGKKLLERLPMCYRRSQLHVLGSLQFDAEDAPPSSEVRTADTVNVGTTYV
jgi:hypothetical protein